MSQSFNPTSLWCWLLCWTKPSTLNSEDRFVKGRLEERITSQKNKNKAKLGVLMNLFILVCIGYESSVKISGSNLSASVILCLTVGFKLHITWYCRFWKLKHCSLSCSSASKKNLVYVGIFLINSNYTWLSYIITTAWRVKCFSYLICFWTAGTFPSNKKHLKELCMSCPQDPESKFIPNVVL